MQSSETFLVQDVSEETTYLSCNENVKSEIVIPIFNSGQVFGELDIDSDEISPFTEKDTVFLKKIEEETSRFL
jgi:L-methionine (R)-S-oxide reductase